MDISRKVEYKIEVLIPPNISDPLNLNEDDSGMSRLIDWLSFEIVTGW